VHLATPTTVSASPINYTLSGSVEIGSSYTYDITGTFTYDPSTGIESAASITFTGPDIPSSPTFIPGTYTENGTAFDPTINEATPGAGQDASFGWIYASVGVTPTGTLVLIKFDSPLETTTTSDTINALFINDNGQGQFGCTTCSTAEAAVTATPLPAAAPLFASGLGAMGVFGWRRKRKNTAVLAA